MDNSYHLCLPRTVMTAYNYPGVSPRFSYLSHSKAGKLDGNVALHQDWAGIGLCLRSARKSSHFVWCASSVGLRASVVVSRCSVRFSVAMLRRLLRRLMERSFGVDHGLVYLSILDLPTCDLAGLG